MKDQHWGCDFMQRYVVTIDLAQKLKAAGWKKETVFRWYTDEMANGRWSLGRVSDELVMFMAPTLGELWEDFVGSDLVVHQEKDGVVVFLRADFRIKKYRLVDALAELWISSKK